MIKNDTDKTPVINGVDIRLKFIPFRCVVCNGFGSLKYGAIKCQACKGSGYVVIDQEKPAVNGGRDESRMDQNS